MASLDPSLAEIHLELTEEEAKSGGLSGSLAWLTEGMGIESAQYVSSFRLFKLQH